MTIIIYFPDNTIWLGTVMKNFATQALYSAPFSVDTFFVLSGLLVSYLFLRDFHKRQIGPVGLLKALPVIYLHRYVRYDFQHAKHNLYVCDNIEKQD